MSLRRLVLLAISMVLGATLVAPAGATTMAEEDPFPGGSWTEHHHESEVALDSRDWFLYVPDSLPDGPVPLVVYLHGCTQDATEAALGVRWNETADIEGFIVAYPQQFDPNELAPGAEQTEAHLFGGNGSQCWNWFRPEHMNRDAGEPATIAAITREVIATHEIDEERVYLAGISAGGIMASTMGATHPDLYAAIGVLSGCGYSACADLDGSRAAAAMGEHARPMPTIIMHGTADTLSAYPMGLQARRQWVATNDLVDDGAANGSVSQTPASSVDVGLDASIFDGLGTLGDTCVRNSQWPCPGGALGWDEYPHTIETHQDANGCEIVQFWTLHGMEHAYPGGDPRGTFIDPLGPGATPTTWAFFQRHTRSGPRMAACPDAVIVDAEPLDASPDDVEAPDVTDPVLPQSGLPEPGLLLLGGALVALGATLVRRPREGCA